MPSNVGEKRQQSTELESFALIFLGVFLQGQDLTEVL